MQRNYSNYEKKLELINFLCLGELFDSLFLGNPHISRIWSMGIRWIYKHWWFYSLDGAFWVSEPTFLHPLIN